MSKRTPIFFIGVVALLAAVAFSRGNEDTWLCDGSEWVKHGNPSAQMPASGCGMGLPEGYTLERYSVEKVTEVSCRKNSECSTPGEYLIQSRCPFRSLCLQNKCSVVCPSHE
jgi:hypothetical protein